MSHPNPRSMEDELSLDVGSPGGPVVQVPMPKGSPGQLEESTPLDACLAQLTSETAPSLRIPGSDGESFGFCATYVCASPLPLTVVLVLLRHEK